MVVKKVNEPVEKYLKRVNNNDPILVVRQLRISLSSTRRYKKKYTVNLMLDTS